jgi:hypothetical protein
VGVHCAHQVLDRDHARAREPAPPRPPPPPPFSPSIIISYLVSGVAALLSGACYAELCTEYPVSGGAFSYILVSTR